MPAKRTLARSKTRLSWASDDLAPISLLSSAVSPLVGFVASVSRSFVIALRAMVLFPFWLAQLLTGAKSFMDNPIIGSRALNARGLHTWRVKATHQLAAHRRRRLAARVSLDDRTRFDRDGYLVKRDFLPEPVFTALLEEVKAFRGMAREQIQGDAITRRIACDRSARRAIPSLNVVLTDPRWCGLIRYAGSFNVEPLVYLQTILSGPSRADPQETLHADTFHATVKAWLFLTDVLPGNACFTYVPASHRLTAKRLSWEHERSLLLCSQGDRLSRRGSLRVQPEELRALDLPAPEELAVPPNTLVVADTRGFHARGRSESPTRRVEVWAYGRRNPFLPVTGLDIWRVSGLADRRIGLFWGAGDGLERIGIKRQVWRRCPNRSAFDPAAPPAAARPH